MTTKPQSTEEMMEPCPWCKAVPRALGHYFEVFHKPECFLSEFGNALTRKLIHADKFKAWNARSSSCQCRSSSGQGRSA